MKWILVSSRSNHHLYELWNDSEAILAFSYHVDHGTIRIISEEPRVFLLRKTGFLKNRTVLLSEYGIKLATLIEETENHSGYLEVDERKLHYQIHNHEVLISLVGSVKPLISCGLPSNVINFIPHLLMLCWHQLQPQKNELLQTA